MTSNTQLNGEHQNSPKITSGQKKKRALTKHVKHPKIQSRTIVRPKFEVGLCATELDNEGFVIDFRKLKNEVLNPCYDLLDHSLALGEQGYEEIKKELASMGETLVASRQKIHEEPIEHKMVRNDLPGARNEFPGGMKVTVFAFSPTSERLAKWLYELAAQTLEDDRVKVAYARIYETLNPVESVADYTPSI